MNYDPSPHTVDVPLSIEEAEALVADECRAVAKDRKKVVHLTKRMVATIRAYRQQLQALSKDIQMLQLKQERAGQATTLHPRDAVRYLAPEVLSELVEGHLRERIGAVQRALADAQVATQTAQRELHLVRAATASILEDPSVPAELRARIRYLMEQLPAGGQSGHVPAPVPAPAPAGSGPSSGAAPIENLDDLFG